jgi:hypothetical protein
VKQASTESTGISPVVSSAKATRTCGGATVPMAQEKVSAHNQVQMPRHCTVCGRCDRLEVEKALVGHAEPLRVLARRFETSVSALFRHGSNHLTSEQVPPIRESNQRNGQTEERDQPVSGGVFRLPTTPDPPPTVAHARPRGACPICHSKTWRLLPDERILCDVCHPLPRLRSK